MLKNLIFQKKKKKYAATLIRMVSTLDMSLQGGSSEESSQNMFLRRNMENYLEIISVTPSYLQHCRRCV